MTYEHLRDKYLAHVAACAACHRVWMDFWHLGDHSQYWSILRPCSVAQELLNKITELF